MGDLTNQDKGETKITDGVRDLVINADGSINTVGSTGGGSPTPALLASQDKVYRAAFLLELPISGQEQEVFILRNPALSGKRAIILSQLVGFTDDASVHGTLKNYGNPTVTANGDAITPQPGRIGGTPPASVMTPFAAPVTSAFGALFVADHITGGLVGSGSKSLSVRGTIIVEPGNDCLTTITPDAKDREFVMTLTWAEETI